QLCKILQSIGFRCIQYLPISSSRSCELVQI
ncbi:unnamed protein product, partial [Allacma fusca]